MQCDLLKATLQIKHICQGKKYLSTPILVRPRLRKYILLIISYALYKEHVRFPLPLPNSVTPPSGNAFNFLTIVPVCCSFLRHGRLTHFVTMKPNPNLWEYSWVGHLMDPHPSHLFHSMSTSKKCNNFH